MNWEAVLSEDDLPRGAKRVATVGGTEVLLVNHAGQIHAVANRCPHLQAKLVKGEVTEDGGIVCPRHHSVFDLLTGSVRDWVPWPPLVGRALGALSSEEVLTVYPTKVESGSIWVAIGSPA
jgi:nitrite reductase/ring-hydroxylating ferredoxin subunit